MTSVGGGPARPVAGAELAGTGGGRPRRQLQAGQHWCRAQAWAKEDLLGRCEQPRTKAEAAELTSTPAADLGDGHGQGRTGTVLRRGRREQPRTKVVGTTGGGRGPHMTNSNLN
jgi:hypothetical protein